LDRAEQGSALSVFLIISAIILSVFGFLVGCWYYRKRKRGTRSKRLPTISTTKPLGNLSMEPIGPIDTSSLEQEIPIGSLRDSWVKSSEKPRESEQTTKSLVAAALGLRASAITNGLKLSNSSRASNPTYLLGVNFGSRVSKSTVTVSPISGPPSLSVGPSVSFKSNQGSLDPKFSTQSLEPNINTQTFTPRDEGVHDHLDLGMVVSQKQYASTPPSSKGPNKGSCGPRKDTTSSTVESSIASQLSKSLGPKKDTLAREDNGLPIFSIPKATTLISDKELNVFRVGASDLPSFQARAKGLGPTKDSGLPKFNVRVVSNTLETLNAADAPNPSVSKSIGERTEIGFPKFHAVPDANGMQANIVPVGKSFGLRKKSSMLDPLRIDSNALPSSGLALTLEEVASRAKAENEAAKKLKKKRKKKRLHKLGSTQEEKTSIAMPTAPNIPFAVPRATTLLPNKSLGSRKDTGLPTFPLNPMTGVHDVQLHTTTTTTTTPSKSLGARKESGLPKFNVVDSINVLEDSTSTFSLIPEEKKAAKSLGPRKDTGLPTFNVVGSESL
jgi:hypothetical protein